MTVLAQLLIAAALVATAVIYSSCPDEGQGAGRRAAQDRPGRTRPVS